MRRLDTVRFSVPLVFAGGFKPKIGDRAFINSKGELTSKGRGIPLKAVITSNPINSAYLDKKKTVEIVFVDFLYDLKRKEK